MSSSGQTVIYEQPITELTRLCLRLENLFNRLEYYLTLSPFNAHTQTVMTLLIEILNILDRPDLKNKFGQELRRLINALSRLPETSSLCQETRDQTLNSLNHLIQYFITTHGKIAQPLRQNEFLIAIRQNLLKLGGCSVFDTPLYVYFLAESAETQLKQVKEWLKEFTEIKATVDLLLHITRQAATPIETVAEKGFYNEFLSPQLPCQMIRVILPEKLNLFPKMIVGKHRFSIQFLEPDFNLHPTQAKQDIPFQLVKCII